MLCLVSSHNDTLTLRYLTMNTETNMDSLNKKYEAFKLVKESKTFKNKKLLLDILHYIIEAEEKGIHIKSRIIAIDILGKDNHIEDNKDAYIRAQIHNLRKKLAEYYDTEGKDQKIQLKVPKGKYGIEVIEKQVKKRRFIEKQNLYKVSFFISLPIIVALICVLLYSKTNKPASMPELFEAYNKQTKTTSIIIESTKMYSQYDMTRDKDIFVFEPNVDYTDGHKKNSHQLSRKYPKLKIKGIPLYYMDYYGIETAYSINELFHSNDLKATVYLKNNFNFIPENFVLIGSPRCLDKPQLKKAVKNLDIKFNTSISYFDVHFLVKKGADIKSYPNSSNREDEFSKTYFLIHREILENENTSTIILYGSPLAARYLLKVLLNHEFSKEINNQFGGVLPSSFDIIVEVEGIKGSGVAHKIVYSKK